MSFQQDRIFSLISKSLHGYYIKLLTLTLLAFVSVMLALFMAVVNQQIIDQVFYQKNIQFLFDHMIYVIVGLYIVIIAINVFAGYWNSKVTSQIDSSYKLQFYDRIIHSTLLFHKSHSESDIYYRTFQDLPVVIGYITDVVVNVPTKILFVIAAVTIMFTWSPYITTIYLGLLFVNLLVVLATRKQIYKINASQKKIEQGMVGVVSGDLRQILLIKSYGIEKQKYSQMQDAFKEYIRINIKNKFLLTVVSLLNSSASQVWSILLIIVGAIEVYNNSLSIGAFFAISSISQLASTNALGLLNYVFSYSSTKVSYERFCEYCRGYEEEEFSGNEDLKTDESIEVSGLHYFYPTSKTAALKDTSFMIDPGKILVLLGENGCGKSTLLQLFDRLLRAPGGAILFDGTPIEKISYQSIRDNVGYLPQRGILLNDTIEKNLTLGRQVDRAKMMDYIDAFGVGAVIMALPNKLETVIGEDGYQLSDGNMQKIALIRLLLRKYKLLLLDEPTAPFDIEGKKSFRECIVAYAAENKATVILVTHDKDDLSIADYKIVLS